MKVEASVRLRAAPDEVAAVLNDAEAAPRWQADLVRMEVVSGAANEVGARAHLHYVEGGRAYVMEDELLECVADRRWRSRVSGNGMSAVVETTLADAGGGTDLRMTWSGGPSAWWARPLFALLRRRLRRRLLDDLEALRAYVDGQPSR